MGDSFLAHFGYDNPNSTRITPSVNKFSPAPENRGQPPTFEPGSHPDMLPVEFDTDVTWSLDDQVEECVERLAAMPRLAHGRQGSRTEH